MKKVKLALFVFIASWPCLVMGKYQVCSITINSSDEIEVFKKRLGTRDFEFVELVPLSVETRPNNVHWFTNACNKGYRCDVLIVSGHFGGLFFGEKNNYILPVDIMEKQSCSKSCAGVLSGLKEVFLFGCNTLADKNSDQRTPERYLQVLLEHHMARDMAETVVAARYLPFGLSFQEQMQLVFSDLVAVYGFTSLSPLGRYIRGPLNNYITEMERYYGSYKTYLDQKEPSSSNSFIHRTIGGTIAEVKGIGPDNPQKPLFQKMCQLYTDTTKSVEGIQVVERLMNAGEGPKSYLAIKDFMSRNRNMTGESEVILNRIKNNPNFKREFHALYGQISSRLPYVRIQFLSFLNFFNWVSDDFYRAELKANTLKMIRRPTSEAYDFVTALVYDENIPLEELELKASDIPRGFHSSIWSPLILETLQMRDYLVHRRLMNSCISNINKNPPTLCYQVLKSLGHMRVNDSLIIDKMVEIMNLGHKGLTYYSMYGLAYSGVQREDVHLAIVGYAWHPDRWIWLQSIRSVSQLRAQYPSVNQKLVNFLKESENEEAIKESLRSLHNMAPDIQKLCQVIADRKLYEHKNSEIKDLASKFVPQCVQNWLSLIVKSDDEKVIETSLRSLYNAAPDTKEMCQILKAMRLHEHQSTKIKQSAKKFVPLCTQN